MKEEIFFLKEKNNLLEQLDLPFFIYICSFGLPCLGARLGSWTLFTIFFLGGGGGGGGGGPPPYYRNHVLEIFATL